MRYALALPNAGECADPRIAADLAEIAETAGWDAIFLEDYIVYTNDTYRSLAGFPTYDPWVTLAAMAMRTQHIGLGTSVTPLSRRRPWKLARETVTLDHLSGGRVIVGAGLGDLQDQGFSHVGEVADAKQRAEILDESLDILVGLWSGEPFSYHGKHFTIQETTFLPKPLQLPRIPIWVGGGWPNQGPITRAARFDGAELYKQTSDGSWHDMTPTDVVALKMAIADRRSSSPFSEPFDIVVGGRERRDDWEAERALMQSLAEAGATWWTEWVPAAELLVMRAAIERGPLRVK